MDKTAIEKIEAMAKPNTIGIGGRMYTDKRIFAVEEPEVGRVALYEAAVGAWKLEARKNIANYLRESLKDSGAIVVE